MLDLAIKKCGRIHRYICPKDNMNKTMLKESKQGKEGKPAGAHKC
jgi:hypothetical protein